MEILFPDPDYEYRFEDSPKEMDYGVVAEKVRITSQIMEASGVFYEPERRIGEKLRRGE